MPSTNTATPTTAKPKNAIVRFVGDTISEMKKVTWLSRREVVYLTGLVLVVAISVGIVLGGIDFGFTKLVEKFLLNL
ncbi:MAG: preprotein translocase subunit SecE [Dehalococcoidales bacterium]|nr:preprotein translocase subunit SecE [Dehalococcoidales bacterium]